MELILIHGLGIILILKVKLEYIWTKIKTKENVENFKIDPIKKLIKQRQICKEDTITS